MDSLKDEAIDAATLSTIYIGLKLNNPFMIASAPPTESDSNIMCAFDAGGDAELSQTYYFSLKI